MTADIQALALAFAAAVLVLYVWYLAALSRLFPKLGVTSWKGWVPILNEIEILVRGGVPGWSIVFYFLPVVQLYGIYLKAIALYRINESLGKGAGFTVLGIFFAPLWATLLAGSRMPADGEYDRRVAGLMASPDAAPARAPRADALGAAPVYASAPPPPPTPPVSVSFPSFAVTPEPAWPPLAPPPAAAPAPAPTRPPVSPQTPTPVPVPVPAPTLVAPPQTGTIYNPWAQDRAVAPVASPDPVEPEPEPEPDDDELDRTVAIDRRPPVPWRLETDDGHVIPLRGRTVLLGRKPAAPIGGVSVAAVPDTTKTLSKIHARLELSDDGVWTVFDLDSTNGVIIIEPDGSETLLPQGGSAPVPGRFMLGKVAMRVSFDDLEATR